MLEADIVIVCRDLRRKSMLTIQCGRQGGGRVSVRCQDVLRSVADRLGDMEYPGQKESQPDRFAIHIIVYHLQ